MGIDFSKIDEIMRAYKNNRVFEQVRNEDNEALITWVDDDGAIHNAPCGILRCKKCGGVDVYNTDDEYCKSCERATRFEIITPPPYEEPWLPYPHPEIIQTDLDLVGEKINEILHKTLVMRDDDEYEILTTWVVASYRQQDWQSFPYLQFIGAISSGKTRALEILSMLSYRGVLYATISPAALCREIEKWKITPFIDQAEFNFDRSSESGRENYSIWMCGYRKGQKYVRAKNDNDDDVIRRDVSGFKALASNRVFDEALSSRSIAFFMREGIPEIKDLNNNILEQIQKIRAKLIYLHLLPKTPFNNTNEIEKLEGRLREIYTPLIITTEYLGWNTDTIIDFAKRDSVKKLKEMQETKEGQILQAIKEMIDEGRGGTNLQGETTRILVKDIAEQTGLDSRTIGFRLRALDVERKHCKEGSYVDITDDKTWEQLQYLFRKYGFHLTTIG